jgi:hypothetical protein
MATSLRYASDILGSGLTISTFSLEDLNAIGKAYRQHFDHAKEKGDNNQMLIAYGAMLALDKMKELIGDANSSGNRRS